MKKFINEYKAVRCSKSESETTKTSKFPSKVDSPLEMGVFKWLRRERLTVSVSSDAIPSQDQSPSDTQPTQVGTIRTEEYKRDLAEFQARRSTGNKDIPELPDTPVKKKCGRHSLPVSCTDCAADNTFNYEKKSAAKYKKKSHKRAKSVTADERRHEPLPNIQFLFQNQVFMPGNVYPTYSEPEKAKRHLRKSHRSPDFTIQKQIEFNEDEEQETSPTPIFYKNNSLPFDVKHFLDGSRNVEEVDGAVRDFSKSSKSEDADSEKEKGDISEDKLWEVMSELKHFDQWADEQLKGQDSTKSDDCKSDTSVYGLPIASASNLDVDVDRSKAWNRGTWGVVPVQVKKITGVNLEQVKRKQNTEINILRKCRHPNIILLMGVYPDLQNNTHIICEQCVDSLHGILHIQGRILSAQTAVHYALDIASALVFLRMQGYIHTELTSHSIMITGHDAAKLADLGPCVKLPQETQMSPKNYEMYSPEPQYVNIEDTRESTTAESEPLLSKHSSETYLASNSVAKPYKSYRESDMYRWHAPELFEIDDEGLVHPCVKSEVYSLCLVLWESCNASIPWKSMTYEKLKELYTLWKTGIRLPQDGTYPGGLLALLQSGLTLSRQDRINLDALHTTLANVKTKLEDLEYIIIPARLSKKKSNFSSVAWDTNSPTDDSECLTPMKDFQHKVVVHKVNICSSPDTSEKDPRSDSSPMYETIRKDTFYSKFTAEKCYISDEDQSDEKPILKFAHIPEKDISSACSTPIAKIRARIKDMDTPNALHRSDSTEYCSILSPDNRHFAINEDSNDHSVEKPTAKLSRSFTPMSYKPLHIKVPEFNLDTVKSILKENSGSEKSSYNFDIKNSSLPTTPIARSNKLRKNAWLSGDLSATERIADKLRELNKTPSKNIIEVNRVQSAPETPMVSNASSLQKEQKSENYDLKESSKLDDRSPGSDSLNRDSFTGLRRVEPPADFSPETDCTRERTNSWSFRSSTDRAKVHAGDDVLASVSVKPLVAIHERWIYEANRKTGRSMSLPEDNRSQVQALKPASHCVDTLQKSLPQLGVKRAAKTFRGHPPSPAHSGKSGSSWDNYCQAREAVAKSINFGPRDTERFHTWRKDSEKGTITTEDTNLELKIDQATDTRSIEEFIRELIRKEFQHLLHEMADDTSTSTAHINEEIIDKGVANIMENLKHGEPERKEIKSFSRVKINGNNKPLLQITFSRSGENSLQVLDNCVNVTICDSSASGKDSKINVSMEDTLTGDDVQVHSLKRCQAFNAIQEARSTEDLYIDDDLSTQMQENFGGRVKLIPLHGSLHELLCEREDDCCLLKVKQENGCDTIYFRCDNSDTESRDAIDGCGHDARAHDTVVYKRSISLIEERIQRIFPNKDNRTQTPVIRRHTQSVETDIRKRPKSEMFAQKLDEETRVLSSSSPSLLIKPDKSDEVEVNIENVMSYQDSSSEECIRCQVENDDFELLEKKIEEDIANSHLANLSCGCLGKISEENLSAYEEFAEKE